MGDESAETARGIHDRLRIARERAGLSQGQVARLLEWHRPTLSEIEAGRRRVEASELSRLAELYGVNVEWLLGKSNASDEPLKVAAREIERLKPEELDVLLDLIASIRRKG